MQRPSIDVNGTTLTDEQVATLRTALGYFAAKLQPEDRKRTVRGGKAHVRNIKAIEQVLGGQG